MHYLQHQGDHHIDNSLTAFVLFKYLKVAHAWRKKVGQKVYYHPQSNFSFPKYWF